MGLIRGSKYCYFSATGGDDEIANKLWSTVKCIIMTNIENHFNSGIVEHRNEIEQKEYDDYINRDNFIKLHSQIKGLCKNNNVKFYEINDNYIGEIDNVYKWIDEQVEAKRRS